MAMICEDGSNCKDCGFGWIFWEELDGVERNVKFCPFCGKELKKE